LTVQLAESAGAGAVNAEEPRTPIAGLEIPPEPVELQKLLRESALAVGSEQTSGYEEAFAAWTWERWRAALEASGMSRQSYSDVVVGYRREVWFWILGDRGWAQIMSGLVGRISRRLLRS
jgi:hypothetical protein